MTKKQDEQWGNIELPGLTDEELFNTDWNKKSIAKLAGEMTKNKWDRLTTEERNSIIQTMIDNRDYKSWLESNRKKNQDPKFIEKLKQSQTNAWADSNKRAIRMQGIKNFSESDQFEDWKKFYKSDEFKKSLVKRNTIENRLKISQGKLKPIIVPWGIFDSKRSAVEFAKNNSISDPARKIEKNIKIENSGFYYITKEEYERLTNLNK